VAAEADANYGFKGAVTSAQTPIILGRGVLYSVEGPGDLAVTAGGAGDRAGTVAPGSAWGDGVLSMWNSGAVLNGEAVGSGSRWDTVVVRREWTPNDEPTGTATLMLLEGGTSAAISPSRTTDRGVTTSDQPLALVRFDAGSTNVGQIIDLRVWAGEGGGLVGAAEQAQLYLSSPGSQFMVGDRLHVRRMVSGSPSWGSYDLSRLSAVIDQTTGTIATAGAWTNSIRWSRTGNVVTLQGIPRRSGGLSNPTSSTICTVPAALRPSSGHGFLGYQLWNSETGSRVFPMLIREDGRLQVVVTPQYTGPLVGNANVRFSTSYWVG